jgi:hypothetical protein
MAPVFELGVTELETPEGLRVVPGRISEEAIKYVE